MSTDRILKDKRWWWTKAVWEGLEGGGNELDLKHVQTGRFSLWMLKNIRGQVMSTREETGSLSRIWQQCEDYLLEQKIVVNSWL